MATASGAMLNKSIEWTSLVLDLTEFSSVMLTLGLLLIAFMLNFINSFHCIH